MAVKKATCKKSSSTKPAAGSIAFVAGISDEMREKVRLGTLHTLRAQIREHLLVLDHVAQTTDDLDYIVLLQVRLPLLMPDGVRRLDGAMRSALPIAGKKLQRDKFALWRLFDLLLQASRTPRDEMAWRAWERICSENPTAIGLVRQAAPLFRSARSDSKSARSDSKKFNDVFPDLLRSLGLPAPERTTLKEHIQEWRRSRDSWG